MAILAEYESIELELERHQAEALQSTGYVSVSPGQSGRWRVTASSYVGTLVVEGVELLIRPKIRPENLFLLLEPGLPQSAWRQEAFEYGVTKELLPSIIAFFARSLETTLGRGVLRSYQVRNESIVALRGRVDVAGTFRSAGVLTPVACSYDEFSENILENRVLRAAIRTALRVPRVHLTERQRLMRQLVVLEGVEDVTVSVNDIDAIQITRLNQHYAPVLRLARLVLANLTLKDARGATRASSFMVDMNDLFQRFVTDRLKDLLRGKLNVVSEPTVHLGADGQVVMKPDLVFRKLDGEVSYVGDVKYKLATDARGRSGDYYQLHAYTTAMNLPEGILIYCRSPDNDVTESTVTVRHSGNRLTLRSIDMSGTPDEVEEELAKLANFIALSSRATPALV